MKSVIKILQENFDKWEAKEADGKAIIRTDKPVSDELKALIERSVAYYGGNHNEIVYEIIGE